LESQQPPDDAAAVRAEPGSRAPNCPPFDVVIVGGGLAGAAAAAVLGRAGHRVALIDRHARYPADFRAEQIVGDQAETLRRLGLFRAIVAEASPVHRVLNGRAGRVIGRTDKEHYGLPYEAMVAAMRGEIPPEVTLQIGRVAAIEAGPERQRAVLGDGRAVEGRLLVLATGLGTGLRDALGIRRQVIRDAHSLTLGFDIVSRGPGGAGVAPFTYYGPGPGSRIDYLTVFPMAGATRANLFLYRDVRDPWVAAFKADPAAELRRALPGVERFLGDFAVAGRVQVRVNDLHGVEGHLRDGVVLIGDAFRTSCPAAGTGIGRLLGDIERLRDHLPGWLATPGMGAAKIARFYADPAKAAVDDAALRTAEYMRAAATETGLAWRLHRARVRLQARLPVWALEAARAGRGRLRGA
jgi:2-polyprenyl-6-methoxyphenol hydroxylase-like FAD-dependent oxidoreductase